MPLLVLTADRPPELRELGAGQTIDQVKLYGSAAKWYFEIDDHPATPERMRWLRQLACRAFWTATDGRPGPVHLNFSLREPLVLSEPIPDEEPGGGGRAGGRPWVTRPRTLLAPAPALLDGLRAAVDAHPRAVIVAGRNERDPGLGEALAGLADALALPLLADPLSGARRGPAAVAHYDALLREPEWAAEHAPDLVLRVGDLPTSKPLRQWLHGLDGALQIAFDPEHAWQDPAGAVATIISADPRVLAPEQPREGPRLAGGVDERRPQGVRRDRRDAAEPVGAARGRRARRPPPARGHARGRLLDAGARRRVVLPRPRAAPARARQPRRQRDRRHRLDRVRGRRDRGPDRAADRRRRARPRHRRPARRPPPRARPHDRPAQQRRRRHLPLPPGRRRGRGLRGARRHPARARLRPRRRALRPRPRARASRPSPSAPRSTARAAPRSSRSAPTAPRTASSTGASRKRVVQSVRGRT